MEQLRKLGKLSARNDPRTLRLVDYTSKLPPAPMACNLTSKLSNLGQMLNDSLGDCTCATVGHMIQQWTAESNAQVIPSDTDILALYEAVGNYSPGDESTDNGAVAIDVLNYWGKNGVSGHNILGYACLSTKHVSQLRASVFYFGNSYIGVELPNSASDQDIWDVTNYGTQGDGKPGSWGGHAIPVVAYDETYVYVITWGAIKKMTWAFYSTYCDEAYAVLSNDWINASTKLSPANFDLAALQLDLNLVKEA